MMDSKMSPLAMKLKDIMINLVFLSILMKFNINDEVKR